ncbi:phage recombination protein Bet [Weissella cibaria]|uniref:phage recombination protein Bet n=1 Tax=Weissella cibaria TaxID=137591 RepID=UPI0034E8D1A8
MTTEQPNKNELVYQANGEQINLTPEAVRMITDNPKVTNAEIYNFMQLAKYQHLNPFLKEVYLVKFGEKPADIIVAKDAFMKRAEDDPNYDGFEAGVVVQRGDNVIDELGAFTLPTDKLVGGWAKVYRKDRDRPIYIRISMSEFSKGQATWKNMPATMIRKSAIVNALREAFPKALGAMYTEDDTGRDALTNERRDVTSTPSPADKPTERKGTGLSALLPKEPVETSQNTETAVNDDMVDAQGPAHIDVVADQDETEATQDDLPID